MSRAYRGAAGRIPASSGEICDRMNRRKETARKGGLLRRFCVCRRRKRGGGCAIPSGFGRGKRRSPWPFGRFSGQSCLSRFIAAGCGRKRKYGASMRAPVGETRDVGTSGCRSGFFEPFIVSDRIPGAVPNRCSMEERRVFEKRRHLFPVGVWRVGCSRKRGKGKERMFSDSQGEGFRIRAEYGWSRSGGAVWRPCLRSGAVPVGRLRI